MDTAQQVCISYDPSSIKPDARMQNLMQKAIQNTANDKEKQLFAELWQDRVKRIFENSNDVITIN